MDYSKIRLENERNSHVTKRLNRLGAWGFFKVLYRDNMWRLMGFSLLMLILIAPVYVIQLLGSMAIGKINKTLPNLNSFGFSTGVWDGLGSYYAQQSAANTLTYSLITAGVAMLMFLMLSGGFAVIRDAFWTGKLSTVGVLKSFGRGVVANTPYALGSMALISFGVLGIVYFYKWIAASIFWLAIVLTILVSLLMLVLVTYLLILCSVSVTYKQSFVQNLADSWRLLWMNFLPNIIHVMVALLPLPLYFLFGSGILQIVFLVFMVMFGGMYFPLVWQTFMMRTFALFHPVEAKKKKDVQREERERQLAQAQARADARAKKQKGKKSAAVVVAKPAVVKDAKPEQPAEPEVASPALSDPVDVHVESDFTIDPPEDVSAADAVVEPASDVAVDAGETEGTAE